ncbi:MAG: hypothetical protein ABJH64_02945 [Algoriphagus sp.]|uniref:hypothetical protein n=1 Tax=Algoriphagus sp. TaxID=1872435 RepID=UPI00329A2E8E
MRNNVTVIIRHTNERTLGACLNLLSSQVSSNNIQIISETPFSSAVKKTFEIGIDYNKDWTLAIDADIFVTNDCIYTLVSVAENLEDYFFEIQGRILDKFYGVPRGGGPHLYRTKYLKEAIKFIPKEGTSLRPESDTYDKMAEIGYHYYFGKEVYGLHDYEQFYKDIYRKGFLHAKKHWRYLTHFEKFWFDNKETDFDFSVALLGFEQAQKFNGIVYVDRNFFPMELTDFLEKNGHYEKSNLSKVDNLFVATELNKFFQKTELKEFEKQYFNYVKRSDAK